MDVVAISSLVPESGLPANTAFKALVTLLWPYSSSTGQCALLLADPDFRKRYQKGQVRVRFAGPSARAIGTSKVSIGDEIELSLDGARWVAESDGALVKTPGRGLEGELIFEKRLKLSIRKEGQEERTTLDVDEATSVDNRNGDIPSTPVATRPRMSALGIDDFGVAVYSSPAFMKRLRLSEASFGNSPYAPVSEDDDLDMETSRKRRRVSYKNVTEWRYDASREASPEKQNEGEAVADGTENAESRIELNGNADDEVLVLETQRLVQALDEDSAMKDAALDDESRLQETQPAAVESSLADDRVGKSSTDPAEEEAPPPESFDLQDDRSEVPLESTEAEPRSMPPPSVPRLQMPSVPQHVKDFTLRDVDTMQGEGEDPLTPRLQPVANQTLPLPSPFPTSAIELVPPLPIKETDTRKTETAKAEKEKSAEKDSRQDMVVSEQVNAVKVHSTEEEEGYPAEAEGDGQSDLNAESEGVKITEMEGSSADEDESLERVLGVPGSLSPVGSNAQGPDNISVAEVEEGSEIEPERVVPDTYDGLEFIRSSPLQDVEHADTETSSGAVKMTMDEPRSIVDAHSPSNEPGVDMSFETGYDEEHLASLRAGEESAPEDGSDFGWLTDELRDEINEQDLRDMQEIEASSDDELVHDSDPEELDESFLERSDDDTGDEDVTPLADPQSVILAETWGQEDYESSEDQSDAESFVSQVTPSVPIREVDPFEKPEQENSQAPGLGSDFHGVATSHPKPLLTDEEAAWKERDDAVRAIGGPQLSAHATNPYKLSSIVRDEPLPSIPPPSSRSEVAVVEILSDSDEDADEEMEDEVHEDVNINAEKDTDEEMKAKVYEGARKNTEEGIMEVSRAPSDDDSDHDSELKQDAQKLIGQVRAALIEVMKDEGLDQDIGTRDQTPPSDDQPMSGQKSEVISQGDRESSIYRDDKLPDGQGEAEVLPADESVPTSKAEEEALGSSSQSSRSDGRNTLQHPMALEVPEQGEDSTYTKRSPSHVDDMEEGQTPVPGIEEEQFALNDDDDSREVISDDENQAPLKLSTLPSDLPETAMEPEVGHALEMPMGLVPASETAPSELDDAHRLTSSSFMTLSSSSPAPHGPPSVRSVEEIDLSQVEPDYWIPASLSQLPRTQRTEPVPDSAGSPATTLVPGSSRQSSRVLSPFFEETAATALGSTAQYQPTLFSQDLGWSQLQALQPAIVDTALQDGRGSQITQEPIVPSVEDQDEDTVDDDLLMNYVQHHSPPQHEQHTMPDVNAPEGEVARQSQSLRESDLVMTDAPDLQSREPITQQAEDRSERRKTVALSQGNNFAPRLDNDSSANETGTKAQVANEALSLPMPGVSDVKTSEAANASETKSTSPDQQNKPNPLLIQVDNKSSKTVLPTTPAGHTRSSASRKSLGATMGIVPAVISDWFTPRRTPRRNDDDDKSTEQTAAKVPMTAPPKLRPETRERTISPPVLGRLASQGTSTSLSYFHPLAAVEDYLNQPWAVVDVVAVSTAASKPPAKAKGGQRDFFTVLYLLDPSLQQQNELKEDGPSHDMRVDVFRPWKASLPVMEAGDVVLLRSFVVKSQKHRTYLLSAEASSWCVWRFSASASQDHDAAEVFKPVWARKQEHVVREEIRGPPMDIGQEEREKARALRKWWEESQASMEKEEAPEQSASDGQSVQNQKMAEQGGRH
ncbi:hypothetical protein BDV97DRAFT_36282 [Delphinella strobiligena]|nr:hypothetical protein BDV97DRAFT_36282 [Delphinella strobiligena]